MDLRQQIEQAFPQSKQSFPQSTTQSMQQPMQQQPTMYQHPIQTEAQQYNPQAQFQHQQFSQQPHPQQPVNTYPQQQAQQPTPPKPTVVKKKVEVKSIGVWSMAKFQGLVNTIVGVVMAAVYMVLGTLIGGLMPSIAGGEAADGAVAATMGTGLGTNFYAATLMSPSITVFISIILGSALIGFISGALLAIFYNILSVIVGGIEIELKAK